MKKLFSKLKDFKDSKSAKSKEEDAYKQAIDSEMRKRSDIQVV